LLSIEELEKRVNHEKGLNIETQQIPSELKQRIKSAIINSPLVSPAIKKHLNPSVFAIQTSSSCSGCFPWRDAERFLAASSKIEEVLSSNRSPMPP
jgi:hypothetical protein